MLPGPAITQASFINSQGDTESSEEHLCGDWARSCSKRQGLSANDLHVEFRMNKSFMQQWPVWSFYEILFVSWSLVVSSHGIEEASLLVKGLGIPWGIWKPTPANPETPLRLLLIRAVHDWGYVFVMPNMCKTLGSISRIPHSRKELHGNFFNFIKSGNRESVLLIQTET